jgi:uracil phosphoribosyltransferase
MIIINSTISSTISSTINTIITNNNSINAQSYIVPGLGDAGDLAYGEKI